MREKRALEKWIKFKLSLSQPASFVPSSALSYYRSSIPQLLLFISPFSPHFSPFPPVFYISTLSLPFFFFLNFQTKRARSFLWRRWKSFERFTVSLVTSTRKEETLDACTRRGKMKTDEAEPLGQVITDDPCPRRGSAYLAATWPSSLSPKRTDFYARSTRITGYSDKEGPSCSLRTFFPHSDADRVKGEIDGYHWLRNTLWQRHFESPCEWKSTFWWKSRLYSTLEWLRVSLCDD